MIDDRRFPYEPLRRLIVARFGNKNEIQRMAEPEVEFAACLGFGRTTPYRWRERGLPSQSADRAAIALGLHPSAIWPDWFNNEGEQDDPTTTDRCAVGAA